MAELLIWAKPDKGPDAGHWKRGDIVVVKPDGHTWGKWETKAAWDASGDPNPWPANFVLLKIPGVSVARVEQFLDRWEEDTGQDDAQGRRIFNLLARKRWRLLVSEIPQAIRDILLNTGELTIGVDVTRAQVEARLRRKDDEATADLSP